MQRVIFLFTTCDGIPTGVLLYQYGVGPDGGVVWLPVGGGGIVTRSEVFITDVQGRHCEIFGMNKEHNCWQKKTNK